MHLGKSDIIKCKMWSNLISHASLNITTSILHYFHKLIDSTINFINGNVGYFNWIVLDIIFIHKF